MFSKYQQFQFRKYLSHYSNRKENTHNFRTTLKKQANLDLTKEFLEAKLLYRVNYACSFQCYKHKFCKIDHLDQEIHNKQIAIHHNNASQLANLYHYSKQTWVMAHTEAKLAFLQKYFQAQLPWSSWINNQTSTTLNTCHKANLSLSHLIQRTTHFNLQKVKLKCNLHWSNLVGMRKVQQAKMQTKQYSNLPAFNWSI